MADPVSKGSDGKLYYNLPSGQSVELNKWNSMTQTERQSAYNQSPQQYADVVNNAANQAANKVISWQRGEGSLKDAVNAINETSKYPETLKPVKEAIEATQAADNTVNKVVAWKQGSGDLTGTINAINELNKHPSMIEPVKNAINATEARQAAATAAVNEAYKSYIDWRMGSGTLSSAMAAMNKTAQYKETIEPLGNAINAADKAIRESEAQASPYITYNNQKVLNALAGSASRGTSTWTPRKFESKFGEDYIQYAASQPLTYKDIERIAHNSKSVTAADAIRLGFRPEQSGAAYHLAQDILSGKAEMPTTSIKEPILPEYVKNKFNEYLNISGKYYESNHTQLPARPRPYDVQPVNVERTAADLQIQKAGGLWGVNPDGTIKAGYDVNNPAFGKPTYEYLVKTTGVSVPPTIWSDSRTATQPDYYGMLDRLGKDTKTPYWEKQYQNISISKTEPIRTTIQASSNNTASVEMYPVLNAMGPMQAGLTPINPEPSAEFLSNYYNARPTPGNPLDIGQLRGMWNKENPANVRDYLKTHSSDTGERIPISVPNAGEQTNKAIFGKIKANNKAPYPEIIQTEKMGEFEINGQGYSGKYTETIFNNHESFKPVWNMSEASGEFCINENCYSGKYLTTTQRPAPYAEVNPLPTPADIGLQSYRSGLASIGLNPDDFVSPQERAYGQYAAILRGSTLTEAEYKAQLKEWNTKEFNKEAGAGAAWLGGLGLVGGGPIVGLTGALTGEVMGAASYTAKYLAENYLPERSPLNIVNPYPVMSTEWLKYRGLQQLTSRETDYGLPGLRTSDIYGLGAGIVAAEAAGPKIAEGVATLAKLDRLGITPEWRLSPAYRTVNVGGGKWTGLSIEYNQNALPIIGRTSGKGIGIELGMPKVPISRAGMEAFTPTNPTETAIILRNVALNNVERETIDTARAVMGATQNTRSAFIEQELKKNIESLSPRGVDVVMDFAKAEKAKVYGSYAARQQMPETIPGDELYKLRPIGDIDIQLTGGEGAKKAQELTDKLTAAGETVRISPDKPLLIESQTKTGNWRHSVDIHTYGDLEGGAQEWGYGFQFKGKTIGIGGQQMMPLSEQGLRKGSSTLGIWDESAEVEKRILGGLKVSEEFNIGPKAHRGKDIPDFINTQKVLIESQKKSLNPFTQAKAARAEKSLNRFSDLVQLDTESLSGKVGIGLDFSRSAGSPISEGLKRLPSISASISSLSDRGSPSWGSLDIGSSPASRSSPASSRSASMTTSSPANRSPSTGSRSITISPGKMPSISSVITPSASRSTGSTSTGSRSISASISPTTSKNKGSSNNAKSPYSGGSVKTYTITPSPSPSKSPSRNPLNIPSGGSSSYGNIKTPTISSPPSSPPGSPPRSPRINPPPYEPPTYAGLPSFREEPLKKKGPGFDKYWSKVYKQIIPDLI